MLRRTRRGVLLTLVCCATFGCSQQAPKTAAGSGQPDVATKPVNDSERIIQRCSERWKKVVAGDWIEAYDYLAPSVRKEQTLSDYLMGKARHRYEKPETPQILEIQGDRSFVLVACTWTPVDPSLDRVKMDPGTSLTERIEMVEIWHRSAGEWYYSDVKTTQDFFKTYPALRPSATSPSSGGAASSHGANAR